MTSGGKRRGAISGAFCSMVFAQQKTMKCCGCKRSSKIESHNVTLGVDPCRQGDISTRKVNDTECPPPQQKAMVGGLAQNNGPNNAACRVNAENPRGQKIRGVNVNGDESVVAEQKAMEASGVKVETHDGAFGADAPRRGAESTGHVDGGERPLAEQKAMAPCTGHCSAGAYGGRIIPHDVAVGGDRKRSGGGRTGDIDRGECALV